MADTLPAPPGHATELQPPSAVPVPVVVGGALVGVVALAFFISRAGGKPAVVAPPRPQTPELPQPRLPSDLVPTPERTALLAELERKQQGLAQQRAHLDALAARGPTAVDTKDAFEAELETLRGALKLTERDVEKAEYRAKKATDAELRELKKQDALARAEAEAAAAKRLAEAAAAEKARAEAEAKARVQAQAGRTLSQGLDKTRGGFMARLGQLFGGAQPVDEKQLADLEDVLFGADIGVQTAQRLIDLARDRVKARELTSGDKLRAALRAEITKILAVPGGAFTLQKEKPTVIMVVGVNGAGKTTTIGKLAAKWMGDGKKVLLGAGDTFRAAASEQLQVWSARAKVDIERGGDKAKPSTVAFATVKRGLAEGHDVILCDTAGRLQTDANMMEELKKTRDAMTKVLPSAPHEVLLVLDATNGQNAIHQARQFHELLSITGIALTKLDGTAKGGVIIGICDELKIPVRYVGVGEAIEDLRVFDPKEFVDALFE